MVDPDVDTDSQRPNIGRRQFLGLVGAVGVTGCLRLTSSSTPTESTAGGRQPTGLSATQTPLPSTERSNTGGATTTPTTRQPAQGGDGHSFSHRWRVEAPAQDAVAHDGRFLVVSSTAVTERAPADGSVIWSTTPAAGSFAGNYATDDARVGLSPETAFVGGSGPENGGRLFAVSRDDGSTRWTFSSTVNDVYPVTHASDVVVCSVYDGDASEATVYGLSAANGSVRWEHAVSGFVGLLSVTNGQLHFGSSNALYRCGLDDGSNLTTVSNIPPVAMHIEDGTLFASRYASFAAVELASGSVAWRIDRLGRLQSPLHVFDDRIIVGSDLGVAAIDRAAEDVAWRTTTESAVEEVLPVGDRYIVAVDEGGLVYGLDRVTGDELIRLEEKAGQTVPIATHEATVLVGGESTDAYSIGPPA